MVWIWNCDVNITQVEKSLFKSVYCYNAYLLAMKGLENVKFLYQAFFIARQS